MGKKGKKGGGGGGGGDKPPQSSAPQETQKEQKPSGQQGKKSGRGQQSGQKPQTSPAVQQQAAPAVQQLAVPAVQQQAAPARQHQAGFQGPPPVQQGPPPVQQGPPPGFPGLAAPTSTAPQSFWGRGMSQVRGPAPPQQGRGMPPVRGPAPVQQSRGAPSQSGPPTSPWVRPQTAPAPSPTVQPQQKPRGPYTQKTTGQPEKELSPSSRGSTPTQSITPSSSSSSVSLGAESQKTVGGVTRKLDQMSLASLSIPQRESTGTYGDKITIETNHLRLAIKNPNIKVFHYDVDIQPEKPFRMYKKVVEEFRRRKYRNNYFAFDGRKNIFTNIEMDAETVDEFTVRDDEKSMDHKGIDYKVVVSFANQFTLSKIMDYAKNGSSLQPPQLMIQALDLCLRHPASMNPKFVSVGRSYFSYPKNEPKVSLGGGLNLWYGFYQSAIIGWKPFLNVDVAHKGFPDPVNCVDAYHNLTNADPKQELQSHHYQIFNQYIKNLKVIYEIPGQRNSKRTYKITGLAESPRKKIFQEDQNKKSLSVEEYFAKKKNCPLKFPNLPCLQAGAKTPQRDCCLPMELCTIMEGQVSNKKLDENQTAQMVRNAARPTYERKKRIMNAIRDVNYNSDPCVNQFGISVSAEFERIDARIIPPPKLLYKGARVTEVSKGVWNPGQFISPGTLNNWAIINVDQRTNAGTLDNLYQQFKQYGVTVGIEVKSPTIKSPRLGRGDIRGPLKEEFDTLQKKSVELVVVVIPPFGDAYGKVKQTAELYSGVLTQCLKSKTVQMKLNRATVINILLKVNAKLNGHNHSLSITDDRFNFLVRPVMIMGADVTHPSPDQIDIPSIAAVTASFDPKVFKYNIEWRLQESRMEIIVDLQNIVKNHLMFFYTKTKYKPEKIIFYRDGVSEGQFKEVLNKEVQAIRNACKALQKSGYEPSITFIVVQKRHHTRLFPINDKDADGRNKNVPAGTVVDQVITHPTEKDFYLNSHASIQGTSKPTKYHVLWDDNNYSMDGLQVMTYYLCHMFTRCTRSISYPAPTYYAHLAAFRIRAYCEGMRYDDLRNTRLIDVQDRVKAAHPMFYV